MAIFGLAVAGCGGSSEKESSAATDSKEAFEVQAGTTVTPNRDLSKAEFITKVNKFCQKAWPMVRNNYKVYSGTQDKTLSEKERTADAIRLSLMAGIDFHIFDNIHFLGAPKGEEVEVEEIIGSMQEAVERGQRLGPLYSVAEVTALFSDYNKLATQYGLDKDCLVNAVNIKI